MKSVNFKFLLILIIFTSFIFSAQKISAGILSIDPTMVTGKIGDECTSYFPVRINTEGYETNSADIKITYDPLKVQIYDFIPTESGVQIQNGNVFLGLPYNQSDNILGEIKVTGYRLNSFNGEGVFFYVYFKPLQFNTTANFNIDFTVVNDTYDSNIAETSTSLDLLTSIQNQSFELKDGLCPDPIIIPDPEIDPGVENPNPSLPSYPVSTPIVIIPEIPNIDVPNNQDAQNSILDDLIQSINLLIENIPVVIPIIILIPLILIPGFITGSPLEYIIFFIASFLVKRKYWGVVFDIFTFDKLAFTTIRLFRIKDSTEIFLAQTISDMDGRYGLRIGEPGKYVVKFFRENYQVAQKSINIVDSGEVILDVGLTPLVHNNLSFYVRLRGFIRENTANLFSFLRIVSIIIMSIGTYLTYNFVRNQPSVLNMFILFIYALLLIIQIVGLLIEISNNKIGKVIDKDTNQNLKGVVVRFNNLEDKKSRDEISITNKKGILKVRVGKGKYKYQATRTGYGIESGFLQINDNGRIDESILMSKSSNSVKKFGEL